MPAAWRSGRTGIAGQYDTCTVVRRGGNDVGQSLGLAMGNGAESAAGLGADAADGDDAVGIPVLDIPEIILMPDRLLSLCRDASFGSAEA